MSAAARNAVVTGANKGIGLELVKQLSEGGSYSTIYAICRKSSDGLSKLAGSSNDKIKVLDAIQVTDESAPTSLKEALKDVPIHLLIHNAGAYGPPSSDKDSPIYATQTLTTITAERMRFAFELNTVAPLMLTQALVSNLEQAAAAAGDDGSKVIIISSAMGSIAENGSGGHYGYRTAKAAVNMVGMTLAQDLKGKKIAVSMSKYNCNYEMRNAGLVGKVCH